MSEPTVTGTPEYDNLIRIQKEAKEQIEKAGRAAVEALFKNFFVTHPEVTGVGWTQYAPRFNDGDPCTFHVRDFYYTVKTDVKFAEVSSLYNEDEEDGNGWREPSYGKKGDKRTREIDEAVKTLNRASDDDVFEAAFGSDALVIATPAGFHVNEYSHD